MDTLGAEDDPFDRPMELRRRGTITQKTLQAPNVGTLRLAFKTPNQAVHNLKSFVANLRLAQDSGLGPLVSLLNHEHPKIRGLAKTVIDSLIKKAGSTIGGGARLNEKVGWPAITELFSYADEAARVGTLLTLATLANSPENADQVMKFIGMKNLANLVSSPSQKIVFAVTSLIGNLTLHEQWQAVVMEVMPSLVQHLRSTNLQTRFNVVICIGNLVVDPSNVKSLKVHLPLLVEFLQLTQSRDSAMLVCAAATAIGNLSTDEGRVEAAQLGAVPHLIALVKNSEPKIVRSGSQALANVCSAAESHQFFEAHFVKLIEVLIDLLLMPPANQDLKDAQFYAAKVFNGMSIQSVFAEMFVSRGGVAVLEKFSKAYEDEETQQEAAQALQIVEAGDKERRATNPDLPTTPPVSHGNQTPTPAPAVSVSTPFGVITEVVRKDSRIRSFRPSPDVLQDISAQNSSAPAQPSRSNSATNVNVISNSSAHYVNVNQNTVAVVPSASSPSPSSTSQPSQNLSSSNHILMKNPSPRNPAAQAASANENYLPFPPPQPQPKLSEEETVRKLSNIESVRKATLTLKSKNDKEIEVAVDDLRKLAEDDIGKETLREEGSIASLVALIHSPNEKVQLRSIEVLTELAKNARNRDEIREKGGLTALCDVLKSFGKGPDNRTAVNASRAVLALAANERNAGWLRDSGIIQLLTPMISADRPELATICCRVIASVMLNNVQAQLKFSESKGLQFVSKVLLALNTNSELRISAVIVLASFCENNTRSSKELHRAGMLPLLIAQLSAREGSEALYYHTLWTFVCFYQEEKPLMEALKDAKVVPHLIRLIGTPSGKVVFYALMNIRLLVRGLGAKFAELLRESGAVPAIVKLMESADGRVKMQATGTLFELARVSNKIQDILMSSGGQKEVVQGLLTADDENMIYWCLGIIWVTAKKGKERRRKWRDLGVLEPIAGFRSHRSEHIRKGALHAAELLERKEKK